MEKKIEFKDIIALINKAVEKKCNIRAYSGDIIIYNLDEKLEISISEEGNLEIFFWINESLPYIININAVERAEICLLIEKLKEYSKNLTVEKFYNFFKEDEPKVTDINNLDDEED